MAKQTIAGHKHTFLVRPNRLGGCYSTKIHIRAEGLGKPMAFVLTSGERHEAIAFQALMQAAKVKRIGCGRPKSRPRYFLGDKAYSSEVMRRELRSPWDYSRHSPTASRRSAVIVLTLGLYRERNPC